MAYCVHCGVELAPSESKCPLCQTPVPDSCRPAPNEVPGPYPETFEYFRRHINIRFGFGISLLFILAVSLLVLAIDALTAPKMSWSFYVTGALMCLEIILFVPLFIRGYRPYTHVTLDFVALALYMLLLGRLTGSYLWVFHLALPLLAVITLCLYASFYVLRRFHRGIFIRLAGFLLALIITMLAMDGIIDHYLSSIKLNWSIFAGIPLLALAVFFVLLDRHKRLRESLHKRIFF